MCKCVSSKHPTLSAATVAEIVVAAAAAAAAVLVAAAAIAPLLDMSHGNDPSQTGSMHTNNPKDAGVNSRWVTPPTIPVPLTRCTISVENMKPTLRMIKVNPR